MAEMKVVKQDGYSLISNYHLIDKRLSWRAKGLLSAILSLSGEYGFDEFFQLASDGQIKDGTEEGLTELERYGYLKHSPYGGNGTEYVVYERPLIKESLKTPISEIPYAEDIPARTLNMESEEEEQAKLRERLNLKAVSEKCPEKFVETVFLELCRRDAEFRQMMTAKAFELVCLTVWEGCRAESYGTVNTELINKYLDNIVLGIRSAGGGNEIINHLGMRERTVNK